MGASGVNWNNVPHESILSQINGGAGVAPVVSAADGYRRIAATLRAADQDLRSALAAAGASWEGRAASDMHAASTPLATWADEADEMARRTGTAAEVFGDQFADTRAGMPPVVDVPSGGWLDDTGLNNLPGVTTDRERAEEQADAAQQEAARRMENYDNASDETVRTQYFSQPPVVVLEVPPPSTAGGPPVGGTSTPAGAPAGTGTYGMPGGFAPPAAPSGGTWQSPGGQTNGGGASTIQVVPGSNTTTAGTQAPTFTGPVGGGLPNGGGLPGGGSTVVPPPIPPYLGGGRPPLPGQAGPGFDGTRPGPGAPRPGVAGAPGAGGQPGRSVFGPGGGLSGLGVADDVHQRPANLGGPGLAAAGQDGRSGLPGRGAAGGGGSGLGPMGGAGARDDDDVEHQRPDYLVETEDIWGDGVRVAPPVIGERPGG